jgi:hypothetical protein
MSFQGDVECEARSRMNLRRTIRRYLPSEPARSELLEPFTEPEMLVLILKQLPCRCLSDNFRRVEHRKNKLHLSGRGERKTCRCVSRLSVFTENQLHLEVLGARRRRAKFSHFHQFFFSFLRFKSLFLTLRVLSCRSEGGKLKQKQSRLTIFSRKSLTRQCKYTSLPN